MEKQQVNIRLPKILINAVKKQSEMLGLSNNDIYTTALFEYFMEKGLIDVKREG